jgi:hypothetical protein
MKIELRPKHIAAFFVSAIVLYYIYSCLYALRVALPSDLGAAASFEAIFWVLAASAGAAVIISRQRLNRVTIILIAVLFAFLFDVTVANRAHYNAIWTTDKAGVSYDLMKSDLSQYGADSIELQGLSYHPEYDFFVADAEGGAVIFSGLNRVVTSVYVESVFEQLGEGFDSIQYQIVFDDQDAAGKATPAYNVVRGLAESEYAEFNALGKVSQLTLVFSGGAVFKSVTLNRTIPLSIFTLRVLLLTLIIFVIYLFAVQDFRVPVFNSKSLKQNLGFVGLIVILAALSVLVAGNTMINYGTSPYNYMVDGLLKGQFNMDMPIPEALQTMPDPYDYAARTALGIPNWNGLPFWDDAYYNGKVYMLHGIVPVVVLYLPYRILTGSDLSNLVAMVIFTVAAGTFLMLLWRSITAKFLSKMPYVLFMCGAAAVYCCSFLFTNLWMLRKYEISSASGIMFVALGLWLLFKSVYREKLSYVQLVFASICLALSVGCRPTMIFATILVPILVLPVIYKQGKVKIIKTVAIVAATYIIVAIPIVGYNYVRFGSISQFGHSYAINAGHSGLDAAYLPTVSWMSRFEGLRDIVFSPLSTTDKFPFVISAGAAARAPESPNNYPAQTAGILNFPIIWLLFFSVVVFRQIGKERREIRAFWFGTLMLGLGILLFYGHMLGGNSSYGVDFMWMLVFPALICAYFLWERANESGVLVKVFSFACVVSALPCIMIPSETTGGAMVIKHTIYYYLSRVFNVFVS